MILGGNSPSINTKYNSNVSCEYMNINQTYSSLVENYNILKECNYDQDDYAINKNKITIK